MNRLFVVLIILFQGYCAFGQITYTTTNGGDWNTPGNWDVNGVPPATLPAGDFIVVINSMTTVPALIIDGSMTISSTGSITTNQIFEVGQNDNTASVTNDGMITVTNGVEFKVKGNGTDTDLTDNDPIIDNNWVGPSFINNGTINTNGKFSIGNNNGGGIFINSSSGIVTTTGAQDVHIDGTLINETGGLFDMQNAGSILKMHGAYVTGGGTINTPLIEFDDNTSRDGTFGAQNISDGLGCSGGGTDGGVTYTIKGDLTNYTFQTLIDGGGVDGSQYLFTDPANFTSCGESGASILPVELVSFNGKSNEGKVELTWSAATEVNNDHYEIQSSKDGLSFSKIGEVQGNGTTNEAINYSFVDETPPGFKNYYRLKQVDYDGKFEYFNTIMVLSDDLEGIKIYPNPTSDNPVLVVELNNFLEPKLVSVELTDISGRILEKKSGYNHSFEFSTVLLTQGTYLVKISMNSLVRTSKVLVN